MKYGTKRSVNVDYEDGQRNELGHITLIVHQPSSINHFVASFYKPK